MDGLLENIDRLHTTVLGAERIRKNLRIQTEDVGGVELVYLGGLCQDYGDCLQLYHHHRAFTGA